MSLIAELKRRSVFKVGAAYLVVAWLSIQAASILFPTFEAPPWALRIFVLAVFIGFPIALVMSWVFEVGGGGVKIEDSGRDELKFYGLIGALAALAFGWYHFGQPAVRAPAEPAVAADVRSIAVLPFVNMSDDPANEYFSDGIAEEILNVLAKSPELRVAARTSSFSFKGQNLEIPDIARELKVRMVLEGSVRKQGGKVRITAQLIDAQEGFHVWSETYDRDLQDVFAIQDEIARAIGKALQVKLIGAAAPAAAGATPAAANASGAAGAGGAAGNSVGTTNLEAYDLYLRGVALWQTRRGPELREAARLFERATELDPKFARAYAGIAMVNAVTPYFAAVDANESDRKSLAAASRAAQLDPSLAEPVAVFGNLDRRRPERWVASVAHLRHAVALNPSYATAHQWLGLQLYSLGDLAGAEAELRAARTLDPRSVVIGGNLALVLEHSGRHEEAAAICTQVYSIHPVHLACDNIALSTALRGGDGAQVTRALTKIAAAKPGAATAALLAELSAAFEGRGERKAAAHRVAAARYNSVFTEGDANFVNEFGIPRLLLALGEPDLAAKRLADGAAAGSSDFISLIAWDMGLDPIRCLPPFKAMVASWGVVDPRAGAICR